MGTLHDIRVVEGFLELPETCERHISNSGLVGSAVLLCGVNKAIDKRGVALSLSLYLSFLLLTV